MNNEEGNLEARPKGMLVQPREDDDRIVDASTASSGPFIKIRICYGSSLYEFHVPSHSTFGELKKLVAPKTGLNTKDQRLLFRGIDKEDEDYLDASGVKNLSKLLLLEESVSKHRRFEEMKRSTEISKACDAVAQVRAEVDKLSQKVNSLETTVHSGNRVDEKEFVVLTEMFMRQLLKLDGIGAEGEAKVQRKFEVQRIQSFEERLDALKARNTNPVTSCSKTESVKTKSESFESGVAPPTSSPSTQITQEGTLRRDTLGTRWPLDKPSKGRSGL